MPSSPARRPTGSSPTRRHSGTPPRPPPKPKMPSSPRRTQSYQPGNSPTPRASARPPPATRRHTTQMQPRTQRALPPIPGQASSPSRRHMSSPAPAAGRGAPHVLIPVPIRAQDAESPVYVRAPSGQHVDFVFSPPKKRGIITRLLDSVEWGDPEENKPYRYRKPSPKPASSNARPFYKKILP